LIADRWLKLFLLLTYFFIDGDTPQKISFGGAIRFAHCVPNSELSNNSVHVPGKHGKRGKRVPRLQIANIMANKFKKFAQHAPKWGWLCLLLFFFFLGMGIYESPSKTGISPNVLGTILTVLFYGAMIFFAVWLAGKFMPDKDGDIKE